MTSPLKIIFAGTPDFAVPALKELWHSEHQICCVYTQPDRPAGRGRKLTPSPVKQYALEYNIPVCQPISLRKPEPQAELKAWNADVMVVAAYGLILPAVVLATPRYGCINIHASLLPRWRGAAPIQRAILAGDAETGITVMQMDIGLDTGDMLHKVACPILPTDTAQALHNRLAELGAKALLPVLTQVQTGTLMPSPQNEALTCYAPKIEKAEAQIDWSQDADYLERFIRAYNPWPVAYTLLNGAPLRIWHAQALAETTTVKPGTIIAADKQGIDVATGQGILRLLTIQLPGGKALSTKDLLNSSKHLLFIGTML